MYSIIIASNKTRRLSMMKFSRAISRVKWLSGEQTNVSKTISVLVLWVLVWQWLGRTFWPNIYTWPGLFTQPVGNQVVVHTQPWSRQSGHRTRPPTGRVNSPGQVYVFGQNILPNHCQTSTLRTRTEMVFQTLVCSPLNHLTRLTARENFIIREKVSRVTALQKYVEEFSIVIEIINEFKKGHWPRINIIKDENGNLLAGPQSVLNRWTFFLTRC
jgi:hypothetical protein